MPALPLDHHLYYGSLPPVALLEDAAQKEILLRTYVTTYLDEEVRAEALVRKVATFAKFLELAGIESGRLINLTSISREIGVAASSIGTYFEILEDCLITERIEPITQSASRKRLVKAPKYLFFDLGVRRLCAGEGTALPRETRGVLFEQFVGLALLRIIRSESLPARLFFWRDHDGPEVDWVVDYTGSYIPIEVKMSDTPTKSDARHLELFMNEYPAAKRGYVVCTAPRKMNLTARVEAVPWQELHESLPDSASLP